MIQISLLHCSYVSIILAATIASGGSYTVYTICHKDSLTTAVSDKKNLDVPHYYSSLHVYSIRLLHMHITSSYHAYAIYQPSLAYVAPTLNAYATNIQVLYCILSIFCHYTLTSPFTSPILTRPSQTKYGQQLWLNIQPTFL